MEDCMTQLAIDISLCFENLQRITSILSDRLSKSSKGIYMKGDDLNELCGILERVATMRKTVSECNGRMSSSVAESYYLKGKVEHMTQVLQLCYNDYKSNNRSDATTFLTIELNKLS